MNRVDVPPCVLTPRRFPRGSVEPALNPPDRFVAVRTPTGRVGLMSNFDNTDEGTRQLIDELNCRIIIAEMLRTKLTK